MFVVVIIFPLSSVSIVTNIVLLIPCDGVVTVFVPVIFPELSVKVVTLTLLDVPSELVVCVSNTLFPLLSI